MRRLFSLLGIALGLLAIFAGGGFLYIEKTFDAPSALASERVLVIPKGAGLGEIASLLKNAGIIDRPLVFKAGTWLFSRGKPLQAGEYAFPAAVSARTVLEILIMGKAVLHRLTVPEGATVADVWTLLRESTLLDGDLPDMPTEGSLLPETYFHLRGETRAVLAARMQAAMDAKMAVLWPARDKDLPFDAPEAAVTLASIVEKETAVPEERALIAGVFINRLRQHMRLQSDPTVIYALTLGKTALGRGLTYADLSVESPYNTYAVDGLPPEPIANPGEAALRAVLHPAKTKALYFVADGSGGHVFAETLSEHNRNVAKWRKLQRMRSRPRTGG